MSDEKIFQEIKGIFSWLEKKQQQEESKDSQQQQQQKLEKKGSMKGIQEESYQDLYLEQLNKEERMKRTKEQIKNFLKFLDVDAEQEEIEALNELANPEGKDAKLSFDAFYKIFVQDEEEKEKKCNELTDAFKNLTEDKNEEYITLDRLDKVMNLYDKKYNGEMKQKILAEIESSKACQSSKFYYNDYINEQFKKNN